MEYLPGPENLGKYWVIDIEGDGLPSNVVWCLCAVNAGTREEIQLTGHSAIKDWVNEKYKEGCAFVGHNILGYDAPTLNRLCGTVLPVGRLVDTMLLSMVYSPSLVGGHSLEAWGERLRFPKLQFNDWSKLTPEMLVYCMQDSRLCLRIFTTLIQRMCKVGFSELGLEIQHRSWALIQKQKATGFPFNIKEAHVLYAKLREIENGLQEQIYHYWPPKLQLLRVFSRANKQDGTPTKDYERHSQCYEHLRILEDGRYEAYGYVSFNIGSPSQRIEKLLALGWEPREFTKPSKTHPNGQPKATDKGELVPSLVAFVEESGKEEVRLIADWITYNSRATMVNTWIEAYNAETGRIHGSLWLANTLRYRHSNPNSANIPAVRVHEEKDPITNEVVAKWPLMAAEGQYTYEARDLWTCSDRNARRLVGVDAKGIQLRVLAHYLDNPKFTEAVLAGDPHSYNQSVGGFASRAIAKTFIYAFLLGSGDAKTGQIIGGSPRDGKEIKARFIGNFPGLEQLLDRLEQQVNRTGRIILCDGTPVIVSKPHTRLGYLLQGDEQAIMKRAAILVDRENRRRGLDVMKVGDIHDEWQNDVLLDHVDEFTVDVCPPLFNATGKFFNYRIPIDCDCKVGLTWAETH